MLKCGNFALSPEYDLDDVVHTLPWIRYFHVLDLISSKEVRHREASCAIIRTSVFKNSEFRRIAKYQIVTKPIIMPA